MNNQSPFVKNEINVGDYVGVLTKYRMKRGEVVKINKKTIKVKSTNPSDYGKTKNYPKEKVAHMYDVVSIVCDYKKNPSSLYFDYSEFPQYAKPVHQSTPATFVEKN